VAKPPFPPKPAGKPAPGDKKGGKPMPPWMAKKSGKAPAMKSGGKVKC
jgi:hypothetical protein